MIEVEDPPLPPPRAVRRTYGKPKQPVVDVAVSSSLSAVPDTSTDPVSPIDDNVDDKDTGEQDDPAVSHHTPSSSLDHDHTTSADISGLAPLGGGDGEIPWDGLKKGKHADWRKAIADSDEEDEDPREVGDVGAGGEETTAYERAKALLKSTITGNGNDIQVNDDDSARTDHESATQEAISSSLPALTSDDPLALPLSNTIDEQRRISHAEQDGEEETAPIRIRKRVVKPSAQLSPTLSSSSSSSSTRSKTPTRTHKRTRRSEDEHEHMATTTTSELPSSQPEYQRQLDLAREKAERKRLRRREKAAAAAVGNTSDEDDGHGREVEAEGEEEEGGLQTSPASPTLRRGLAQSGRRRRVVAASSDEEDDDGENNGGGDGGGSTPVPARNGTSTGTRKVKKRTVAVVDSSPVQPGLAAAGAAVVGLSDDEDGEDDEDEDGGFSKTLTNIFAKSAAAGLRAPGSPSAGTILQEELPVEGYQEEVDQGAQSPTTTTTRGTRRNWKGKGKVGRRAVSSGSEGASSADDHAEGRKRTRVKVGLTLLL